MGLLVSVSVGRVDRLMHVGPGMARVASPVAKVARGVPPGRAPLFSVRYYTFSAFSFLVYECFSARSVQPEHPVR